MVDEKEGVVGRVLQCGHAVRAGASDPRVDGIVRHLKLDLKVAVVSLLEGQQDLAVEERLFAVLWVLEELLSERSAGGLVESFNDAVVERVVVLLRHQSRKFRECFRPVPVRDSHPSSHLAHHLLQDSDVQAMPLREAGHAVMAAGNGLAAQLAQAWVAVPFGEFLVGRGGESLLHLAESVAQALRLGCRQRVDVLTNSHTRHCVGHLVSGSTLTPRMTAISQSIATPEQRTYINSLEHLNTEHDKKHSVDCNIRTTNVHQTIATP